MAAGGAIVLAGPGSGLTNVTFTGNTATGTYAYGGAIFDEGGAQFIGGSIVQNTASTAGGGVFQALTPELYLGVTVSGNTVTNDSFASAGGGGIYAQGPIILANSTVANNTVTVSGTGLGGGGVLNTAGMQAIATTFSGNSVVGTVPSPHGGGGGILSTQSLSIENSTISNNSSKGDGGGILIDNSAGTSLGNVTVFQNAAAGVGGNLDLTSSSTATLEQSIVARGTAGTGADVDNGGTLASGDYNIIQTSVAGPFTPGTHDLQTDPQLLALANNGGQTFTNADQATSPGTGRIPFSGHCGAVLVAADQRGYSRGAGGVCDVGAYEFAGVATAVRHRPALPKPHFRHTHDARFRVLRLPHLKPLKIKLPE